MPPGSAAGIHPLVFHLRQSIHDNNYLLFSKRSDLSRTLAVATMGSEGPSRRPFCPTCSKATRTCICSRFPLPPLNNSISVTILLHSLEKKHPLNSTRVAKLGLKNLEIYPVTDVNFHAELFVRPLLGNGREAREKPGAEEGWDFSATRVDGLREGLASNDNNINCMGCSSADSLNLQNPWKTLDSYPSATFHKQNPLSVLSGPKRLDLEHHEDYPLDKDDPVTITSGKCTVTCSSSGIKMFVERSAKPKIDWVFKTAIGRAAISHGFVVNKLQRKELQPSKEFKDFMEFEIMVPPGAALLFPSDKAISLKAVDFEVRHLVVLDGTWAKAKRIYHENPWLQLLPHLKLDLERESLYAEVRQEPKAGCFSTIESIVCAMKELGGDIEGLDKLLDVFRSMIGDQRVCKDDKFKGISVTYV
ncbi:hypothetical protein Cni_G13645 [Canna indica]|uniref:tRNA-uridine aminocarboxypropyltransferase n=1 Tax=Canna indica TaxID=4628 RepID=A0AAQ3KEQ4_9LILI|nr:hypothetical protein Cni_G13645 [Canna indica]